MAFISILEISIVLFCFIFFKCLLIKNKKTHSSFLTNWPVLGMLPGLLIEIHRVYDYVTECVEAANLTYVFKGPCFGGLDMIITVDPANIHHIMSSNFANYPKGPEFKKMFDVLGDGIFNSDADLWKDLRKSAQSMMNHHDFQRFTLSTSLNKLEKGLVPILNHVSNNKLVVDLQDLFQRFTFDTTFVLATGYDPRSLDIEMPENEFANALDDAEEAIFYRHVKPEIVWKMQNWIGFGDELKMKRAHKTFDNICVKYITSKRDEISRGNINLDLLSSYMKLDTTKYKLLDPSYDRFLRDTILSFMIAGRDTTGSRLTWFFWLLSKNPQVVTKIREEINTKLSSRVTGIKTDCWGFGSESFDLQELKKLVYLHGAICEALRLYPPVPFQHKAPTKPDVLPSGHKVDVNSKIVFCVYSLGRMRSVWGEDALEFKPERWILETGKSVHEPSYKFFSFNAGPRTCLGKDVAFMQMKTIAIRVLQNYEFRVVEGHKIESVPSVILHMKHGLKVNVTKRWLV